MKYLLFLLCGALYFQRSHGNNKYRRVCYYSSWAIYRPSSGKFSPSDIDPFLCTHIIYAFAKLNDESFTLEPFDPWADLDDNYGLGGYSKMMQLRQQNPRLKVLISVGGWNAASQGFSAMVSQRFRRKTFIESAIKFLRKYSFDGLDINWEFPTVRGGKPEDKPNFAVFVQELRAAVEAEQAISGQQRLLISAAVSASEGTVQGAYDVPILGKNLDFISLMTYDFHGSWDTHVEHHSPIYGRQRDHDTVPGFNMVSAIKLWLNSGCPADKIVVGVPLYGRSFTLADARNNMPGSVANGGENPVLSPESPVSSLISSLLMDNTWTVVIDPEERVPYATKDNQWIGYDDIDSIIKKSVIVREWGLGGVMVWSVDMDDFRGLCGLQPYPLIRIMKKVLEFQPMRVVAQLPQQLPALLPPVGQQFSAIPAQPVVPQIQQVQAVTAAPKNVFHMTPAPLKTTARPHFFEQNHFHLPTESLSPKMFFVDNTMLPPAQPNDFHLEQNMNKQGQFSQIETNAVAMNNALENQKRTTDMTASDSNLNYGIMGYGNGGGRGSNLDFRPPECPNEGFFRNPSDCSRFYRCINAVGSYTVYHFVCPPGLVFDINHNVCNWANAAPPCTY